MNKHNNRSQINNTAQWDLNYISDDFEWDELVSSSQESNAFLKSSFLRSIGQENTRAILNFKGKAVLGTCLFPIEEIKIDNVYAFCSYQGAFFPNLNKADYSDENERIRRFQHFAHIIDLTGAQRHFSFHPNINDIRGFDWYYHNLHNANLQPTFRTRYTGTISLEKLSNFEKYLATIRKERLREYKKSLQRSDVVYTNLKNVEDFLTIYDLTFARQGEKISSALKNRIKEIITTGLKNNSGKLKMLYSEQGEPIAGVFILSDLKTDYYLFGANDIRYKEAHGPTRLLLDSIKESFESSKTNFDFCGMNSPTRGNFKSSFNARVTPYFELDLIRKKN